MICKNNSKKSENSFTANLYVALIHFPVMNKNGTKIGSALTSIDLHDIARAGRTFGVKGFYVVTPFKDQATLASQIVEHWTRGIGGRLNPARKQALGLIRITYTFEEILQHIKKETNIAPITIATSAKKYKDSINCKNLKCALEKAQPHVLVFGTAWGLTEEFINSCDGRLAPIFGTDYYNHLSVRSAVSIYLDRITRGNQETI